MYNELHVTEYDGFVNFKLALLTNMAFEIIDTLQCIYFYTKRNISLQVTKFIFLQICSHVTSSCCQKMEVEEKLPNLFVLLYSFKYNIFFFDVKLIKL